MSSEESIVDARCEEATLAQAAGVLGISRPRLVTLVKQGEIPCRMVGLHRMIPISGILEYQARASGERAPSRDEQRRGLSAMAEFTNALGLGY